MTLGISYLFLFVDQAPSFSSFFFRTSPNEEGEVGTSPDFRRPFSAEVVLYPSRRTDFPSFLLARAYSSETETPPTSFLLTMRAIPRFFSSPRGECKNC